MAWLNPKLEIFQLAGDDGWRVWILPVCGHCWNELLSVVHNFELLSVVHNFAEYAIFGGYWFFFSDCSDQDSISLAYIDILLYCQITSAIWLMLKAHDQHSKNIMSLLLLLGSRWTQSLLYCTNQMCPKIIIICINVYHFRKSKTFYIWEREREKCTKLFFHILYLFNILNSNTWGNSNN